jgi:hypothetical protein
MNRRWVFGLGAAAAVAAAAAATGLLQGDWADFAWGMAAGLAFGAVVCWFVKSSD